MTTKDFDADLATATEENRDPVTFTLGGREWTADFIPERLRLKLLAAVAPARRSQILDQMLDILVVSDQREDFARFTLEGFTEERETVTVREQDVDGMDVERDEEKIIRHAAQAPSLETLYKVVAYVVGEQTGRPTTPPSP